MLEFDHVAPPTTCSPDPAGEGVLSLKQLKRVLRDAYWEGHKSRIV